MLRTGYYRYVVLGRWRRLKRVVAAALLAVLIVIGNAGQVHALVPPPGPKSGSIGVEGTISQPPPTKAATIGNPTNGRVFTTLPISVSGTCPQGEIVRVFSNNIFVGAVTCVNGSFALLVDLFSGTNELIARVYDNLDQAGPDSVAVTVTFNDEGPNAFDSRVNLTSNYAKKGANPGEVLRWPITISGGVGPYAMSIDWGDGKPPTLKSVAFADTVFIDHVYDAAGIYRVIVKISDSRGSTGYLQLIGVGNGLVTDTSTADGKAATPATVEIRYSIWPMLLTIPLIFLAFWLGRKHQVQVIRKRIEQTERDGSA